VATDVEVRAVTGIAPIEQERSTAHSGHCYAERNFLIKIKDMRWIDERWYEDGRLSLATEIMQRGWPNLSRGRTSRPPLEALGALIFRQPVQRRSRQLRLLFADAAYQFEKQRERARSAFMLRCTLVR